MNEELILEKISNIEKSIERNSVQLDEISKIATRQQLIEKDELNCKENIIKPLEKRIERVEEKQSTSGKNALSILSLIISIVVGLIAIISNLTSKVITQKFNKTGFVYDSAILVKKTEVKQKQELTNKEK